MLGCPSWGQWRSIVQHFVAGSKVEAIKLLRASTYAWTQGPTALPPYIANEGWRAFMLANALPAWDRRGGLNLSEAKGIVDAMEAAPHWFGVDPHREYSPRPAEREEPTLKFGDITVGPREDAPKSLGDLLREKINAMNAEEEPREHSLWLNIYPDEPGYAQAIANGSRAEADVNASPRRIACINITFKEGEGL